MKVELMKLGVQIITLLITAYLAPAVLSWLAQKSEDARENRVKDWAVKAVRGAEQVYRDYAKTDPYGIKRRNYAREIIRRANKRYRMALTEDDIDALIEAAVQELSIAGTYVLIQEPGQETEGTAENK